jgi:transposase
MDRRHPDDLTDEQWKRIEHLIPQSTARTGRPANDRRLMLDGIFWICSAGTRWRQLDSRFGPYQTVHAYFSRWRRDGVLAKIVEELQVDLDKRGLIDWDLWNVDGSNVRASKSAAGAEKKVSTANRRSRPTTPWAEVKVDLAPSSTWLLTARALPWPSESRPARSAKSRRPSRSSERRCKR